jgi:hypothetical protein
MNGKIVCFKLDPCKERVVGSVVSELRGLWECPVYRRVICCLGTAHESVAVRLDTLERD